MAELTYKDRLKLDLFPTIWCPGCGIGTIMMMLAMVLDEMKLDERNTVIVTGSAAPAGWAATSSTRRSTRSTAAPCRSLRRSRRSARR